MRLRPTRAIINLDAIAHNMAEVQRLVGDEVRVLGVVKADAYGHGAVEVARELETRGCHYLGVATVEEGLELRKNDIILPILLLGGVSPTADTAEVLLEERLTPVVFDLETARTLNEEAAGEEQELPIHLKLDTGMGRIGILFEGFEAFLKEIQPLEHLQVEGIMTHFAYADLSGKSQTLHQLALLQSAMSICEKNGLKPKYVHIANSAAVIDFSQAHFNLARPGIMLYGAYPAPSFMEKIALRPAMTLKSAVIQLKWVPSGTPISYGGTFVTERKSRIATMPVGYADGYLRGLSNRAQVLVRGKRAPVVGTVCMDLCMVDVTEVDGVEMGDEVVLLGTQGEDEISADEVAGWLDTISYEVLCTIGKRVPRVYVRDQ